MILKDYYWYFRSVVSKETCESIIELSKEKQRSLGLIGDLSESDINNERNLGRLYEARNSQVAWFNEKWMYEMLQTYTDIANNSAGWNFDWDWCEDIQFTVYEPGGYYNWHADQSPEVYTSGVDENRRGKYRKLSVILNLTDPNTFEGGDLEFDYGNGTIKTCEEIRYQGSVVVFPSFVYHRVVPVTKGVRYSLVMWSLGPPYR